MSIKILVTLGPSSMSEEVVSQMTENGVAMFRINLSHTALDGVEDTIRKIQSWTNVPLCLDSEGAQIRNQNMINESVFFNEGDIVRIHHESVVGDSGNISFAPISVSRQFQVGDSIRVDFNAASLRIEEIEDQYLLAVVECAGQVGSNKATDINREVSLDAITFKDQEAFKIGLDMGVRNFSLSFTNSAEDVKAMRKIIGNESNLISKIESVKGILNLAEIMPLADQILIDRGDMSRQVAVEKIPFMQRKIISFAKSVEVPVFVATNLLEGMVNSHTPTRAEVNDVISTLLMGADGLVLAAETAIGKNPNGAVEMVNALIGQFYRWSPDLTFNDILSD
jgi:pyruvate kinase